MVELIDKMTELIKKENEDAKTIDALLHKAENDTDPARRKSLLKLGHEVKDNFIERLEAEGLRWYITFIIDTQYLAIDWHQDEPFLGFGIHQPIKAHWFD
jgi:hypothetical protein